MKRLFFVAGESSGDLHGSNLIRALHARRANLRFEGLGGPRMADAGMTLHYDLASDAIMGFVEVVRHFPNIRRLFNETVARFDADPPDALVLIDYPGFNIRLAKAAKARGIPVVYYISPQVWAWKKGRLNTLAQCVDRMIVVFPFEVPLYEEAGIECTYAGHPLMDHIDRLALPGPPPAAPVIALLPGSRAQEIARHMPVINALATGIAKAYPEARFMIPCVDEARAAQIESLTRKARAHGCDITIEVGGNYRILAQARFAVVASGTATLETTLFRVPMVILYKVRPLTYWIARALVDIEYIGMVNILAERGVVPEFIQHEATARRILPTALELIDDSPARAAMLDGLEAVRSKLGGPGASRRAARTILKLLEGD